MADLNQAQASAPGHKPRLRVRKRSTRIDMTAMVDVAFLLLTFFVLTASLADQHQIKLTMPVPDSALPIAEHKIMTLVLDRDDVIRYYVGGRDIDLKQTDFANGGLRQVLLTHLNHGTTAGIPGCDPNAPASGCWDPIFVIKPRAGSRYKNLVDVLDELAITGAGKYAIGRFTPEDSLLITPKLPAASPLAIR